MYYREFIQILTMLQKKERKCLNKTTENVQVALEKGNGKGN